MKLSIAQALKYQKRVVEAIQKVTSDITSYNSVDIVVDTTNQKLPANRYGVDVKASFEKRTKLKGILTSLKLALWNESKEIRPDLVAIGELKDDATFLAGINTEHGAEANSGYSLNSNPKYKEAIFQKQDIENKIKSVKKEIDTRQEKIEQFNYTHFIEVEDIENL